MTYKVKTLRDAGLEARWTKNRAGAPIIVARNPNASLEHQRDTWWYVSRSMWSAMNERGIVTAFDECTALGNLFSISA